MRNGARRDPGQVRGNAVRVTLTVTDLEGADRELTAGFGQLCKYEKHTGRSVLSWQKATPGVYDFAVLAWIVETGMAVPFDSWTDTVGMVVMTGFTKTDPTKPADSAG